MKPLHSIAQTALHTLLIAASLAAVSCSSDDESAAPSLTVEDSPAAVTIPAKGITKAKRVAVTVRSNTRWTVSATPDDASGWLHLFAGEGEDDGIFRYWADSNTAFTPRTATLSITMADGTQAAAIQIEQEADIPTAEIKAAADGYKALAAGGQLRIPVTHNIEWTARLQPETIWARIDSCSADTAYIHLEANDDDTRTVTLTVRGAGEYALQCQSQTIITQADAGVFLNERFDWLQEGIEDYYYNYPEQAISKWTDDEISHGWTTQGTSLYGGRGYIKLGKTNYAGDALSPALSAISGTEDIEISLKCIGYVSKGGAKDDGVLRVMLSGPGEITSHQLTEMEVNGQTYKAATLDITVFPNSSKLENGEGYDPWAQPGASFTLKAKGATSETRLLLVGGAAWGASLKGIGQGKNRLLIDDIRIRRAR